MTLVNIHAPSSKSMSHRALIAASLAQGESHVQNVLRSQDLERTMDCLRVLGADIQEHQGGFRVRGIDWNSQGPSGPCELDVGESGTTCRLITPLAALGRSPCRVFGRGRMHERPIRELTTALERLGSSFEWLGPAGCPPFVIKPGGLEGGELDISLEQSSQFLSGLLLAAPLARREMILNIGGSKAVSWPYVALTLQVMEQFGTVFEVQVRKDLTWRSVPWQTVTRAIPGELRFRIQPSAYQSRSFQVEGDWSNASYFLAAGTQLTGGLQVLNLKPDSVQGDAAIQDILTRMGARLEWNDAGLSVYPGALQGADLDMGACPDLVPTVAVLAALANGSTRIRNVAHLRLKESDRLQALAVEIRKTGCGVHLLEDGLEIRPDGGLRQGTVAFSSHDDHRIAMSLSLFGLAGIDVQLDNPDCVDKSFPDFWEHWQKLDRG
jgi:3-phosphoshikimate 1-carboxyvinyltransferase